MSTESPKLEASTRKVATAGKQSPLHVIRDGGVAASIWQKTTGHGLTYLEFTLSRSWKTKSGKSGYSQAFFGRNEAALINVAKQASAYIADFEAKAAANDNLAA